MFLTTQYLEEADAAVRAPGDHRRRTHRARGDAGDAEGRPEATTRARLRTDARRRLPRRHRPHSENAAPARSRRFRHERRPPSSPSARCARPSARPTRCSRRSSSRCSSSWSTSGRRRRSSRPARRRSSKGQSYAAFQLPSTLLLAASFGTAALYLVEEIENGYFDKLRATPVPAHVARAGTADRRGGEDRRHDDR